MNKKVSSTTTIIQEENCLTLIELCSAVHCHQSTIVEYIEYEVILPMGDKKNTNNMRFDDYCLKRTRQALQLQNDWNIHAEALGFVIDLLEKIDELNTKYQ